jgi:hypothetical protein
MDEVEFIQVELPIDEYEMRIRSLVEILLKMDEEMTIKEEYSERKAA